MKLDRKAVIKWFSGSVIALAILAIALSWTQHVLNSREARAAFPTPETGSKHTTTSPGLSVLWNVPSFSLIDQNGKPFTNQSLAGHAWVANFIFTQCTTACPIMSTQMAALQRSIPDPDVRFVSFSVDPAHDTPEVLRRYANEWRPNETRWTLLQTSPQTLQPLVRGMNVSAEHTHDPNSPILHSSLFFLIDGVGQVRGLYNSVDDESMKQLAADLKTLARETGGTRDRATASRALITTESSGGKTDGATLFTSLGCNACHSQPRLAPPLGGLFNTKVLVNNGHSVVADRSYIIESILNPPAKIVDGYINIMPSYRPHLTDDEVARLATYVQSLPATSTELLSASTQPARVVIDPVCAMKIRLEPGCPEATTGGVKFYFCSELCRNKFLHDPAKYARAATTRPASN